jgi:hypothetical protein
MVKETACEICGAQENTMIVIAGHLFCRSCRTKIKHTIEKLYIDKTHRLEQYRVSPVVTEQRKQLAEGASE